MVSACGIPAASDDLPGIPPERCPTHNASECGITMKRGRLCYAYECGCELDFAGPETTSHPHPDAEPAPCSSHGSPFVKVNIEGGATWRVFEDGCMEPM